MTKTSPTAFDRRALLQSFAAIAAATGAAGIGEEAFAQSVGLRLGPEQPFSFDILKQMARERAAKPYVAPAQVAPEIVDKLDYDAWGKIKYKPEAAIYADGAAPFPITFFHLGKFFKKPISAYLANGPTAREIIYDSSAFDMPADSPAHGLKAGSGFAGLRIQERKGGDLDWKTNDWAAFLGAAYFRAIGADRQYGLSARGVALDTWQAGRDEEFPDFTKFWIGPETDDTLTLHALMDGPGIAGAFRFLMKRDKAVVMDIDCALFPRKDYIRFGLAPLTSMYWYSETRKPEAIDWRPEVHDSDGLAIWTGSGEHIWRPLNNPSRVMASAFGDDNPKGFGLIQRDRNFDHYLDGVYYDRRPSVWVEPKQSWGKGAVQLIEIPTDDEIHDNIVAMWVPEKPVKPGEEVNLSYRVHWRSQEPYPSDLAICTGTRMGNGGVPGQPRPKGVRKFMVDFLGGPLKNLPKGVKPEAVLSASRGTFSYVYTEAVFDDVPGHWRAQFDLTVEGADPVEMRLVLRENEKIISETWLYQYHPF